MVYRFKKCGNYWRHLLKQSSSNAHVKWIPHKHAYQYKIPVVNIALMMHPDTSKFQWTEVDQRRVSAPAHFYVKLEVPTGQLHASSAAFTKEI